MRRSLSSRRAIGSSLTSGAHARARSRTIENLTTVKALWLVPPSLGFPAAALSVEWVGADEAKMHGRV